MKKAAELVSQLRPELICDGDIQADTAVNSQILERIFPFSHLKGSANILVFPNLESSNIAYKLLQQIGNRSGWPLLDGSSSQCQCSSANDHGRRHRPFRVVPLLWKLNISKPIELPMNQGRIRLIEGLAIHVCPIPDLCESPRIVSIMDFHLQVRGLGQSAFILSLRPPSSPTRDFV